MAVQLVANPRVFDRHERHGKFLVNHRWEDLPTNNAGYVVGEDKIVELRDSEDASRFFQLTNHLALGEEIVWKGYDSAFLTPKWVQPTRVGPLALWDLQSGERVQTLAGYHLGALRGARLLDGHRLVTWARDLLLRVWDIRNGELREVMPLPAVLDESARPIVSSRSCSDWTNQQFEAYLTGGDENLRFAVTLMIQTEQASRIEAYGSKGGDSQFFERYIFQRDAEFHSIPPPFRELENAEAGYSDSVVLADGRLLIGGITYGAKDHTYVWDGGLELTILYTSLNDFANFNIDGEIAPGVIQLSNSTTAMTFNLG